MTVFRPITLHPAQPLPCQGPATSLYESVLQGAPGTDQQRLQRYLQESLDSVVDAPCELPADVNEWPAWVADNAHSVGQKYAQYLEARHAGGPRQFFTNKAHALYFLQQVAPSKLVDGAWLYSTLKHPTDWRFHSLIRTYLEELGDGDPALNHVGLYRNLLTEHDCAPTQPIAEERYVQGALQLALGYLGEDYLPEVIGYNLGYEQLPLHLLISAFELNELGIDPYYFTLHVTIDNASSGHARKALEAVTDFLATADDPADFLTRVRNGYRLNDLGAGSASIIESFDLEQQLVNMLEAKRTFGQHMHSDYCRLEGRTVNEWLAAPGQSRNFLAALENKGWIKRHQDPCESRFWQLIDGAGAAMFGVFSGYEKQLLRDWISGDFIDSPPAPFRARFRRRQDSSKQTGESVRPRQLPLEALIDQISPALHHTPQGLSATRSYATQFARGLFQ